MKKMFFASDEQALQYLSDVTGQKVLVAAKKKKKWSGDVKTKWTPPPELFTKPAETIANTLAKAGQTLKRAMARLNFYINRSGANLSDKDKARLDHAKELLHAKFEKNED
jgi:beta-lactam-binding protein with PASTA domain